MKNLIKVLKLTFSASRGLSDKRQEVLIRAGRAEFKRLIEKGLSVPVMFL